MIATPIARKTSPRVRDGRVHGGGPGQGRGVRGRRERDGSECQPLSRLRIRQLEQAMGTSLFHCMTRRVELTEARAPPPEEGLCIAPIIIRSAALQWVN